MTSKVMWSTPACATSDAPDAARELIGIGIAADALRWTVCALSPSLDAIYVVQVFHGLAVAGFVVGSALSAVLYVEGDRPGAFDRGQVITLQTLADGIGILLRTAELYETLEDTNARLVELDRTKSEALTASGFVTEYTADNSRLVSVRLFPMVGVSVNEK